ncbi:SH3 domain-containing protein [Salinarimonas rosea]|uniref:SH3 domain-containing protein n=1 Tax=Salinarimonas rosea TaxID=552063 RepID=UPI00041A64ED|nr:SH3 domain-containing protein [Salinarimonas rosea]
MSVKTIFQRLGLAAATCLVAGAAWAYPAEVSRDLNLRAGPGTNYQVIATMPGGVVVDVEGCRGSWCRVDYRGRSGWASARYLGEPSVRRGPRAPAPDYGYRERVRPAPGITFEFGFGADRDYYDDRRWRDDDRHWRDDDRHWRRPGRGQGRVIARLDRDGDGYYETIRIRRPDGSVVVRRDLDGDGLFDDVVRRF